MLPNLLLLKHFSPRSSLTKCEYAVSVVATVSVVAMDRVGVVAMGAVSATVGVGLHEVKKLNGGCY